MKAPSAMEVVYLSILLLAILIILIHWRLDSALKWIGAISRLDTKLDLLLKHAGIEYDPYKNLPLEVIDAVRRGNKIEAIKRQNSGVSLKQAKDFIEEVQQRAEVGT